MAHGLERAYTLMNRLYFTGRTDEALGVVGVLSAEEFDGN